MMASLEGLVSLILSTQRHFAKDAPSFLYCAQRSDNPSSPVEDIWRRWLHGRRWTASAVKLINLTLCGGFSCGSCQGNYTFVYLRWREAGMNGGQVDSFKKKESERLTWPWFPPGRRGLWSFWRKRRRCRSTGTTSRGRRWPLRGSCWRGHPLRRGSAGTVCGSPPCSPLPPGPGASPCCLWRATLSGYEHRWLLVRSGWPEQRWWIIVDARIPCRTCVLQTDRLVCSQDALPWRNYTEGCLMEFPLLRLGERGDLVRHPPAAFGCPVDDLFPLKNLLFVCNW